RSAVSQAARPTPAGSKPLTFISKGATEMTPKTALDEGSAITPIIVKSGGDPHVSITSSSISFAETVPGPSWSSSQSKENGRIRKLKIKVGCDTTELPVIPTSQLASVT